jgi:DNA-binding LacI/PurR family transcriptional regulator
MKKDKFCLTEMKRFISFQPVASVTLKQIAADLNLSLAAVSTALGTKSTSKVSPETMERVRAHAQKLNYRPSLIGKSMRSRRLKQVGIVTQFDFDARIVPVVAMPAILGLDSFLRARDWQLNTIEDNGERLEETMLPRYLREHFLDGVVVCSTSNTRDKVLRKDFEKFSIPAIFLNAIGAQNCISIDDRCGASLAVRHLLEWGHRKILFVGTRSNHYSMGERLAGFQETLKKVKLPARFNLLPAMGFDQKPGYQDRLEYNYDAGRNFVNEVYLKQRPTAIVCYDDRVALILMKGLHDAGISVPDDVSVIGYNDVPFMDLMTIPLTTVRTDFYTLGRLSGQMLLELIEKEDGSLQSIVVKPELIVRQSTRPL